MKDRPKILDIFSILAEIKKITLGIGLSFAGFSCLAFFCFCPGLITIAESEYIGAAGVSAAVLVSFCVYIAVLNIAYVIYCGVFSRWSLQFYCSRYFIVLFVLGVMVGFFLFSIFVSAYMVLVDRNIFIADVEVVREKERFCDAIVLVLFWEFFLRGVVSCSLLKYYNEHVAVNAGVQSPSCANYAAI